MELHVDFAKFWLALLLPGATLVIIIVQYKDMNVLVPGKKLLIIALSNPF